MEKTFGKDATREFMAVFPDIVRELTIEGFHKDLPVINKHLSKVSKKPASKVYHSNFYFAGGKQFNYEL